MWLEPRSLGRGKEAGALLTAALLAQPLAGEIKIAGDHEREIRKFVADSARCLGVAGDHLTDKVRQALSAERAQRGG